MNPTLQKMFSTLYSPLFTNGNKVGASSISGTDELRGKIVSLFEEYNITSMFDAGCNDCNWIKLISQYVNYHGGDISLAMVADAWHRHPELDIVVHDVTTDPLPLVDVLFVRDVAIHLNDQYRSRLWKNWYSSNIPWILITHNQEVESNLDFQYTQDTFPFSSTNWLISPWNFPAPTSLINEYGHNGRCMALWHRDQFKGIL